MKKYKLKTILNNGEIIDSTISVSNHKNYTILVYSDQNITIEEKDEYPFLALVKIREELEKNSTFIICKGSRIDVYPSSMSFMGYGAYILTLGKTTTDKDFIGIFEEELDLEKIKSTKKQLKYRYNWIKSITSNPKIVERVNKEILDKGLTNI